MSQNSMRVSWTREVVDERLRTIMKRIHEQCRETADEYGKPGNYVHGANIAGFTPGRRRDARARRDLAAVEPVAAATVVACPAGSSIVTAIALGYAIWRIGIASIRSLAPDPDADVPPDVPEDVDELDVYLVCGECGTEFKVSRLGELQVPRHCGEQMQVVRRPADA